MLRRNPGLTILAFLTLTLGIGATTSVFGWVEGILLRPYPAVANQDRLFALVGTSREGRTAVSWPDFQDLRRNCTLEEAFIAEHLFGTTLSIGDRAERATGSVVSANYFQALGIRPILGRTFEPSEDTGRNAHPVTVISYQAWQDRYRGDPAIIGRTQMLNGVQHTIVGVAPKGFYGTFVGYSFQFWVPASMEEVFQPGGYKLENRGERWIEGFALLKRGVTIEQAQGEMSAIAARLEREHPDTNRGRGIRIYRLWETPFNGAAAMLPTLRISVLVACFVLLIACANVGNLLLARSFARRHEMTVRQSLGARRARLFRQLLTESLILSGLATAGGLVVAYWCRNLMKLLFPPRPGIVINFPAEIDWRVLAASAGICVLTAVLFGLVPATEASKIDLAVAMRAESGSVLGGSRRKAWLRSGLVLVQVSLSFLLLVATGLVLKSLEQMRNASPGFSTKGVLTTYVDMRAAGYDRDRMKNFEDEMIRRLENLGGVEAVAWARLNPFSYGVYSSAPIAVDGFETMPGERPTIEYNEVGPGYFGVMGIPLIAGRDFARNDDETAAPVAIVNQEMAARFWRDKDPIRKRVQVNGRWLRIVGVATNAKYRSLAEAPAPFFYVPIRQSVPGSVLEIRTQLGPEAMANALAKHVKTLDPNLAPGEVITLEEQVNRMSWSQTAAVTLLTIFGGIALLLATIGLFGVLSYAVSQSTRELGLRMALGADARELLRLVMTRSLLLTFAGVALGAAGAFGTTRLLGDLLYKVSPRDPAAFGLAFIVMTAAAVVACCVPALRASRIDPVQALRDA